MKSGLSPTVCAVRGERGSRAHGEEEKGRGGGGRRTWSRGIRLAGREPGKRAGKDAGGEKRQLAEWLRQGRGCKRAGRSKLEDIEPGSAG